MQFHFIIPNHSIHFEFTSSELTLLFAIFRYDKEVFDLSINEEVHTIKLIDTAGQEEYGRLRRLFYKEADSFILCYDISSRTSFRNIEQKWMPELTTLDRWPIPVILVGSSKKSHFHKMRR